MPVRLRKLRGQLFGDRSVALRSTVVRRVQHHDSGECLCDAADSEVTIRPELPTAGAAGCVCRHTCAPPASDTRNPASVADAAATRVTAAATPSSCGTVMTCADGDIVATITAPDTAAIRIGFFCMMFDAGPGRARRPCGFPSMSCENTLRRCGRDGRTGWLVLLSRRRSAHGVEDMETTMESKRSELAGIAGCAPPREVKSSNRKHARAESRLNRRTERARDVLTQMAAGHRNPPICNELFITRSAAESTSMPFSPSSSCRRTRRTTGVCAPSPNISPPTPRRPDDRDAGAGPCGRLAARLRRFRGGNGTRGVAGWSGRLWHRFGR